MAKKQVYKAGVLNCRVPSKTRFGAELLCRKHRASLSTLVNAAMEKLFESEGLSTRKEGELLSLLDKIYDERPGVRTRNLLRYAPELLTPQEKMAIETLGEDEKRLGRDFTPEELETKFRDVMSFVEETIFS